MKTDILISHLISEQMWGAIATLKNDFIYIESVIDADWTIIEEQRIWFWRNDFTVWQAVTMVLSPIATI